MIGREKYEKGYVLPSGYIFKNNKTPYNETGKFHVVNRKNVHEVAAILSFKKGKASFMLIIYFIIPYTKLRLSL